jgi:hypothetical protein
MNRRLRRSVKSAAEAAEFVELNNRPPHVGGVELFATRYRAKCPAPCGEGDPSSPLPFASEGPVHA